MAGAATEAGRASSLRAAARSWILSYSLRFMFALRVSAPPRELCADSKRTRARIPKHVLLGLLPAVWLLFAGCKSAPPAAPVPIAVSQGEFIAAVAEKLSQTGNWTMAVREWQRAADQCSLLNNRPGLATAWHNQAQAQRELGKLKDARALLDQAAALNRQLNRTNEWWRNQIALLQIESQQNEDRTLDEHFQRLRSDLPALPSQPLRGLFLNELGQWQTHNQRYTEALDSFGQAEQAFVQARQADGKAAVMANRAQLWLAQTNYPAALAQWQVALSAYEVLGLPLGITRCLEGLGETQLATNRELPAAEEVLRRAAANYRTLKQTQAQARCLRLLIRCLQQQNKPAAAEQAELAALPSPGIPGTKPGS